MLRLFAVYIWIYLPGRFQKKVSSFFSFVFQAQFSKLFIVPYCLFFGLDSNYLNQFEPDSETSTYESYSDFFKINYK